MDHSLGALPPLDTLRAFEAAARSGSFSGAAEVMNLTHGAVSRQIARLERWLGQRLFEREARGVSLTPEGERLFATTTEAFALIAETSDRWSEPQGADIVRLSTLPSICGLWLMPKLARLEAGDPPLRIVFRVDQRQIDLGEGSDLGLRCGRSAMPGRISLQLFEEWCYPVASPALAERLGVGDPKRLLKAPLIHDSKASGWRAWLASHGIDYRPRPQDRRFEDYSLVLAAAANGLGVALARPPLVAEALETGRLVVVDSRTALNPVSYWLDRPLGSPRPAAAALARRIGMEAAVAPAAMERFLTA
jgi:LysR family transcriptional regulator, glycine cleavage system transcriptional activator